MRAVRTYGGPIVPLCDVAGNQSSVVADYLRVEEEQHPHCGRGVSTATATIGRGRGRGRCRGRVFGRYSAVGTAPAAEQREHRSVI